MGTDKWEQNLYQALKILGIGILGIFLVTGIIILVVYALNKLTNIEKKSSESEG
ncbi:MAG: oxaloacetate decarboxylase [Clostridia bacterium]|nr:oxaloacetate decarboxylase [Clostridia bacterium]